MSGPKCMHCGNTGEESGLYITIDARYRPESQAWEMQERGDTGGMSFDCLKCDGQTPAMGEGSFFPYGMYIAIVRPKPRKMIAADIGWRL